MQFNWWLCYYKTQPRQAKTIKCLYLRIKNGLSHDVSKYFSAIFCCIISIFYWPVIILLSAQHKKHDLIWKSQTILMGMYSRKTQSRFMQSITGLCWDHYQWRTRVPHSATAHTNCLNCCQINDKIDPDPLTRQIPLCIYSELRIEVLNFDIINWESR